MPKTCLNLASFRYDCFNMNITITKPPEKPYFVTDATSNCSWELTENQLQSVFAMPYDWRDPKVVHVNYMPVSPWSAFIML